MYATQIEAAQIEIEHRLTDSLTHFKILLPQENKMYCSLYIRHKHWCGDDGEPTSIGDDDDDDGIMW